MKISNIFKLLRGKYRPIKKDRVVFTSYEGHFSDNTMYVYLEMIKIKPDLDYIWLIKEEYINKLPQDTKYYIYNSKEAEYAKETAYLLIDNIYGEKQSYLRKNDLISIIKFKINTFLNNKKGQKLYTTWHATCLKKMGRDQLNSDIIDFSCPNATMMIGNTYSLNILKHLTFDKINMKLIGTPRNSVLFDVKKEDVIKIKEELGLPVDKKIVLFAPTFRTDDFFDTKNVERSGINQLNEMDINLLLETLKQKFGGEFVLVCRFHYHVSELVDWKHMNDLYGNKVINGNLSDETAKYLICTDVVISDVSGIMFDFSTTRKPVFIYFPDEENYSNNERGLYISLDSLPYSKSNSFSGLIENIKSFDSSSFVKKVDDLLNDFGCVDKKTSANDVAKFILKDSGLL